MLSNMMPLCINGENDSDNVEKINLANCCGQAFPMSGGKGVTITAIIKPVKYIKLLWRNNNSIFINYDPSTMEILNSGTYRSMDSGLTWELTSFTMTINSAGNIVIPALSRNDSTCNIVYSI